MKKFFSIALLAVAAMSASAQNVQLHYDFGRNFYSDEEAGRQKVTLVQGRPVGFLVLLCGYRLQS